MPKEQFFKIINFLYEKRKIIIPLLCFLVIVIFLLNGYLYFQEQIKRPLDPENRQEKIVSIDKGKSLKEIARVLEREGIIKKDFYFIFYVWQNEQSGKLQAGKYALSPDMSISGIAEKLVKGEVISEEFQITIPEGFRLSQIETRLVSKGFKFQVLGFRIQDFQEKYEFLNNAPEQADLEGFLFPDTYNFFRDVSPKEIIEKMLDNFKRKLNQELRGEIFKQKKTIYDIIIMASIIEKEVADPEEQRIVSGIFWKRLREKRPFESCATVAYVLKKDKWRYSFEETRIESPYNTYLNLGLPPTPISNPGVQAIRAAIYPLENEFNYFLSDPQTGKTIFSKTLEEHNLNKQKYFK